MVKGCHSGGKGFSLVVKGYQCGGKGLSAGGKGFSLVVKGCQCGGKGLSVLW